MAYMKEEREREREKQNSVPFFPVKSGLIRKVSPYWQTHREKIESGARRPAGISCLPFEFGTSLARSPLHKIFVSLFLKHAHSQDLRPFTPIFE